MRSERRRLRDGAVTPGIDIFAVLQPWLEIKRRGADEKIAWRSRVDWLRCAEAVTNRPAAAWLQPLREMDGWR